VKKTHHAQKQAAKRRKEKTMPAVAAPLKLFTISDQELYERVASKAYELYQQRGETPSHDLDDWLLAERVVHEELLHGPLPEVPVVEEVAYLSEDDRV
jgi:hypothetical protein